jgi:hypothetical protein
MRKTTKGKSKASRLSYKTFIKAPVCSNSTPLDEISSASLSGPSLAQPRTATRPSGWRGRSQRVGKRRKSKWRGGKASRRIKRLSEHIKVPHNKNIASVFTPTPGIPGI